MVNDIIPFPDDLPPRSIAFAREVIKQLGQLKSAQASTGTAVRAVTSNVTQTSTAAAVPDSTEAVAGKARLATDNEARGTNRLPGQLDDTTIITPAKLDYVLSRYITNPYGDAKYLTTDWAVALDAAPSGYVWGPGRIYNESTSSYEAVPNTPPGVASNLYVGTFARMGTFNVIDNAGDLIGASLHVTELDPATKTPVAFWQGITDSGPTINWTKVGNPPAATDTTAGIVELATVAEAVAGTDAATAVTPQGVKAAALASTPVGSCLVWAGSTAPSGFLLCQGQAVSRTTYSALFAVVGTTYGAGNGTTTFNLPKIKVDSNAGIPTPVPGTTITGTFANFDTAWGGMTFANFDAAWTTGNVTMCYIIATGI